MADTLTFLITTNVNYERDSKLYLLQHVHVVRAGDKEQANAHIEEWLDETWAEPAYFGHEYEIHELPGVTMAGEDAAIEYAISETPLIIYQRPEGT